MLKSEGFLANCWCSEVGGSSMRMIWKSRSRGRQLAVLGVFCCLLVLLLHLFVVAVLVPPMPASSATLCSSPLLTPQVDRDDLTLYFTPRSRPITTIVSRFLLEPPSRTCSSRLDLLILVPSPPEAVEKRRAVRKTWGSVASKAWPGSRTDREVAVVFLLGRNGRGEGVNLSALRQEAMTHGDLLVGDFMDSYRNLTRKILAGLNWVSQRCSGRVSYVLKADLDTFVNVELLLDILSQLQRNQSMAHTMLGELLCTEPTNRDPESRVFVESSEYPFAVYPPYVRGGSYVLSGDLVPPVVNASRHLPLLPVEDAFINGVVARALHVRHINLPGVMKSQACPLSPCLFLGTEQVSATNVDPQLMEAIWWQLEQGAHLCHHQASWWTRACIWIGRYLG